MKPLGKAMKIAVKNRSPEKNAISNLLESYRDTPHPATGIPPNAMIFRDQQQTHFPRRALSDHEIEKARALDKTTKICRTERINKSKYKQESQVMIGDQVLIRNNRTSKYHPYFSPDQYEVIEVPAEGSVVKIKREADGKIFVRHPDDIKHNTAPIQTKPKPPPPSQKQLMEKWRASVMSGHSNSEDDYHQTDSDSDTENIVHDPPHNQEPPQSPRIPWVVDAFGGRSPGRGRGRGRPPGRRLVPQLEMPPEPQQFEDDDMPDLSPAVRKSKRVDLPRKNYKE